MTVRPGPGEASTRQGAEAARDLQELGDGQGTHAWVRLPVSRPVGTRAQYLYFVE